MLPSKSPSALVAAFFFTLVFDHMQFLKQF